MKKQGDPNQTSHIDEESFQIDKLNEDEYL